MNGLDLYEFNVQAYNENSNQTISVNVIKEVGPANRYFQLIMLLILVGAILAPFFIAKVISVIRKNKEKSRQRSLNRELRTITINSLKAKMLKDMRESEKEPLLKYQSLIIENNNDSYFTNEYEESFAKNINYSFQEPTTMKSHSMDESLLKSTIKTQIPVPIKLDGPIKDEKDDELSDNDFVGYCSKKEYLKKRLYTILEDEEENNNIASIDFH